MNRRTTDQIFTVCSPWQNYPYATLTDATTGGLMGWGGNTNSLPNHMQDLVFWNRAHNPTWNLAFGMFSPIPRLHHPPPVR